MKKKLIKVLKVLYILLVVVFGSLLVISNIEQFKEITTRFLQIFRINDLKCFFEQHNITNEIIIEETIKEITDEVISTIDKITTPSKPFAEIMLDILNNVLNLTFNFLIYFANIGINILFILFIYFNETFNATKQKIKKTIPARIYLFIFGIISFLVSSLALIIKKTIKLVSDKRRIIGFNIALYLLFNSILYKIIIELLIFLLVYITRAINQQTYLLMLDLAKYLLILIYPFLKQIPAFIYIIIFMVLLYFKAISKAEFRLKKNHERLKEFVDKQLTQTTFLNGPPGSGKTLLNVSCSLASEEVYIDHLEKQLLDYEIKRPYINFAAVRVNPEAFPEHKEYTETLRLLNTRKSFVISNYSIYSPYFKDYSKIFDFNYMRKNKKYGVYPLEEYIIISLSELDKEYNSHDNMKQVGIDGAATFFSTVSHDLKRHVKIFCDYQLKDQVPLRIRGNSEYFYTISKSEKKYPFLLYLYYYPFLVLSKMIRKLLKKYETRKPYINKKTKRKTVAAFKRNDISLIYAILRQLAYVIDKICDYFDHYWYFKIKGELSEQDGAKGEEKKICINICDLSIENMALYDSTFLSYAYEQKRNKAFKDLQRFTSLTPSIEELAACNSVFYNRINGLEPEKTSIKEEQKDDEFIEV